MVPVEDINTAVGSLRLEPTANNQAKGIGGRKIMKYGKKPVMDSNPRPIVFTKALLYQLSYTGLSLLLRLVLSPQVAL